MASELYFPLFPAMLAELLPELHIDILKFLTGADLKNLACCNVEHKNIVQPFIWKSLRLSYSQLRSNISTNQLALFVHTRKIYISSGDEDMTGHTPLRARDIDVMMETMCKNFITIMKHCATSLKYLHVCQHPGISSRALASISQLSGLKELRLDNDNSYRRAMPAWFNATHRLMLCSNSFQEESFKSICGLSLNVLHVSWNGEVCDRWLGHLSSMVSLEELNICDWLASQYRKRLTNNGISRLVTLCNLRVLNVSCTSFSDAGMTFIAKLNVLNELIAKNCLVSGRTVSCLKDLKFLHTLDFNCNSISYESLGGFSHLKNLKRLDVSSCQEITDDGLTDLAKLSWLEHLDICETGITEEGANWLKAALPDMSIEHYEGYLESDDDYDYGIYDDEIYDSFESDDSDNNYVEVEGEFIIF